MLPVRLHAVALIAVMSLPGCIYYGAKSRDVDRTPIVDTGVGATILMPGQSAPSFPGANGTPGEPESGRPGTGSSAELPAAEVAFR